MIASTTSRAVRALLVLTLAAGLGCGGDDAPAADASVSDAAELPDSAPTGPDALEPTCTPVSGTKLGLQEVATGLEDPVLVTSPPGDLRLFVIEKPGRIRIVEDGQLLPTPFLDIDPVVNDNGNEQGLLGLAFHPDYADNGRFFVNYTATDPSGDTIIAEYKVSADPNVADTAETRLLVENQPAGNHNGGMIAFGPDGYLYIGMGDGGGSNDEFGNGQNRTTKLGAMLRIDVDSGAPYAIPVGNPFVNTSTTQPEIWAYGLRNPWRWSFDRQTGDLYIADVGQGDIEEVDVQPASSAGGENYGWNIMEGSSCFGGGSCDMSGLTLPIIDYTHASGRCSVTGGYVYRGSCFPDIDGWYFYADYCTGEIFVFEYVGGEAQNATNVTADIDPDGLLQRVSSFGQDAFGELYVVSFQDGTVYRITAGN